MRSCLILVLTAACSAPPPPRTITVSPDLPDQVLLAAAVARDAWCAADVHWCPELVTEGADSYIAVRHFERETTATKRGRSAHNSGDYIEIAPVLIDAGVDLAGTLTHEFGHYGIEGHVAKSALMHAEFRQAEDIPTVVDVQASIEWCRQQGC